MHIWYKNYLNKAIFLLFIKKLILHFFMSNFILIYYFIYTFCFINSNSLKTKFIKKEDYIKYMENSILFGSRNIKPF
jgi:hypothetical protein